MLGEISEYLISSREKPPRQRLIIKKIIRCIMKKIIRCIIYTDYKEGKAYYGYFSSAWLQEVFTIGYRLNLIFVF